MLLARYPADYDDNGAFVPASEWFPLAEPCTRDVWNELKSDLTFVAGNIYRDDSGCEYLFKGE